jgi:hypothetical protein
LNQAAYHKSCIAQPDSHDAVFKALDAEEEHDTELAALDSSRGFTGEELKPGDARGRGWVGGQSEGEGGRSVQEMAVPWVTHTARHLNWTFSGQLTFGQFPRKIAPGMHIPRRKRKTAKGKSVCCAIAHTGLDYSIVNI